MIKTRADLFEAAAKMMRMCDEAGINYCMKVGNAKFAFTWKDFMPAFFEEDRLEFPLTILEGKPVFVGDVMYDHDEEWKDCPKFVVDDSHAVNGIAKTVSWNPPKPKTVLVELLREDAANWSICLADLMGVETASTRLVKACRKALEK